MQPSSGGSSAATPPPSPTWRRSPHSAAARMRRSPSPARTSRTARSPARTSRNRSLSTNELSATADSSLTGRQDPGRTAGPARRYQRARTGRPDRTEGRHRPTGPTGPGRTPGAERHQRLGVRDQRGAIPAGKFYIESSGMRSEHHAASNKPRCRSATESIPRSPPENRRFAGKNYGSGRTERGA
jgi:hypothetical protein